MPIDLRTIARFSDPIEANLALNRLLDEGIHGAIGGDIANNTLGLGLTSAIELLVPKEESERATVLLAEFAAEVDARQHRPKEAFTAEMPPEPAEEPAAAPTAEEGMVQYAYRASLLGFFICSPALPIAHTYALLLLLCVTFRGKELRQGYSSKYYFAMIVSALSVTAGIVFMIRLIASTWAGLVYAALCILVPFIMFSRTARSSRSTPAPPTSADHED